MPHRGYLTRRGPSYGSSERSPSVYSPKRKSFWGDHLSHSGSLCAKWIQCRSTIRPNHNAETGRLSELSNETTTRRAHTETPREGSAYKPLRPLKSSTRTVKSFYYYLSGQPLSLPLSR